MCNDLFQWGRAITQTVAQAGSLRRQGKHKLTACATEEGNTMQEKHEQLGEFGAIPGAPNGPPNNLSRNESRTDIPVCPAVGTDVVQRAIGTNVVHPSVTPTQADKNACPTSENTQECSLQTPEIPAS